MFKVIFDDPAFLVVDKEARLVTTSSNTQFGASLEELLKQQYQIDVERSGLVHRIDKDTSGLVLVAKTPEILAALQDQFQQRTVKKEYLALVHGLIIHEGRIDAPIARNPANRQKFIVYEFEDEDNDIGSRASVTDYWPIQNFELTDQKLAEIFEDYSKIQIRKVLRSQYTKFTLLRCKPLTGRTHQIRVHLKYIGCPVVGDEKYAGRKTIRLDRRWCNRQFLHASRLEFDHPVSHKRVFFESELPDDLQQALKVLQEITII